MKTLNDSIPKLLFIWLAVILTSCEVQGQNEIDNESSKNKALAPYLQAVGDSSLVPLLNTSAKVQIAGVIADVRISQVFHNTGKKPIEAVYIFPGSTHSAVYAMQMKIGKRTIIAKIEERNKARKDYEAAKKQGKTASLLEQERPNVFKMNVANILPGDTIVVEMCYTELLVPEKGIYQFVYPTVVGPRYSNKNAKKANENDKWVANPYTSEGVKPTYTFNISATINADIPIKDILCSTHKTNINYDGASSANIILDPSEKYSGNRDFILSYRLTGNTVQSGILLCKGDSENFFMAMIQPPQTVKLEEIPAREYIFIVDVSGSMYGFPLSISKEILKKLLSNLRPADRFNVLLFAGGSTLMNEESIPATKENIDKAINIIDNQQGGGGTELIPAVKKVLSLKRLANYSSTIVILTDGYVDVEKETFELIKKNLSNANFFAFGIGSSVNRLLIEGIAHVGQGESFVVTKPDEATAEVEKFYEYVRSPQLTNIKIAFNGFETYDVTPNQLPDVFAQRPVLIYGKWKGKPQGSIAISGITGKGIWEGNLNITSDKCGDKNSAIKYLWARKKVEQLTDYNKVGPNSELQKEITNLGLTYNLLTDYTSFIAIDSEQRTKDTAEMVIQPLPLPEGVSNYSIGGVSSYSQIIKSNSSNNLSEIDVLYDEEATIEELEIFSVVEQNPTFGSGGENEFKEWLSKNLVYPKEAKDKNISGTVYIQFVIDQNGNVSDVKVLRGIDPLLDAEALRVMKLCPPWNPGKQRGKFVKVSYTIPIKFSPN